MTTAEDLQLLLVDPESGASQIGSTENDAVLGGAILFDLVAANRVALVGEGRKAKVEITDPAPLADPLLEESFARIRERRAAKPKDVVTRLGKKTRSSVPEALVNTGALRRREAKALGLFPLTRFDIVDVARREHLRSAVTDVLAGRRTADATTGPLIGLLSAAGLVKKVVPRADRKEAERRAKEVSEGDWASEGVKQAIQAAQAAMMAAVTAATAAGAASSGS